MIEIFGTELFQWDTGRSVKVTEIEADHVHFANKGDSKAVIMDIADSLAKIPDYLLQTGKQLCVYAVKNGVTVESKIIYVKNRERPENYVYEEDQRNYIYALITNAEAAIEAANQSAGVAAQAAAGANTASANANVATQNANASAGSAALAAKNANEAADYANHTAKSLMVIGSAKGDSIHLDGASDQFLLGMRIFGKTTQDGTPTPEAPVELESCGKSGKVGVSMEGKNLLDLNAATFLACINNGGVLVSNVNNAHYAALVCPGLVDTFMACKGKTVTFSANKSIDGRAMAVVIYGKMKNGDPYQSINGKVGERFISFRIAEDFENITSVELRWNRSLSGAFTDTTSSITDLQVEIGEIATTYEPYKGQTITIETPNGLPGIPVTTGGNYVDADGQQWVCDEIDFGRGVYVQRVINKVFDGSSDEPWSTYTYATYEGYSLNAADMAVGNRQNGYCDKIPVNSSTERVLGIWLGVSNNFIYVHNATGLAANAASWRTWLSENPITIQYILATPIETPLSEEELSAYAALRTYRENTTVSNDAGAWMDIEYVMDAKKYIDDMIHPVARLASVSLPASKWTGSGNLYSQVVYIDGITENSQVNLTPTVSQMTIFYEKDITFITENDGGVVTIYVIGQKPTNDYVIPANIVEVRV